MGLLCHNGCVYKKTIPGDCHIQCTYNFKAAGTPTPKFIGSQSQLRWFAFPFNFDPIWGEGCVCKTELKEHLVVEDPLFTLLSLLAR